MQSPVEPNRSSDRNCSAVAGKLTIVSEFARLFEKNYPTYAVRKIVPEL